MRAINTIVIHCSATPNGVFVTPEMIDGWHKQRGFARLQAEVKRFNPDLPHIGYHYVINARGFVRAGRAHAEVGAHVAGWNANSLGVCMTGTDQFFKDQWAALAQLVRELAPTLDAPCRIVGHRDLSPDKDGDGKITSRDWLKICPGFDVSAWLANRMVPLNKNIFDLHPSIAEPNARDRVADVPFIGGK
jgi:N-acetylmuramoyl-L-alanine amidase